MRTKGKMSTAVKNQKLDNGNSNSCYEFKQKRQRLDIGFGVGNSGGMLEVGIVIRWIVDRVSHDDSTCRVVCPGRMVQLRGRDPYTQTVKARLRRCITAATMD